MLMGEESMNTSSVAMRELSFWRISELMSVAEYAVIVAIVDDNMSYYYTKKCNVVFYGSAFSN